MGCRAVRAGALGGGRHRASALSGRALRAWRPPLPIDAKRHPAPAAATRHRSPYARPEHLRIKGVPPCKVIHIYNPYTRGPGQRRAANGSGPDRILYMGNMGFSQNLPALVQAFECSSALGDEVRLILAGTGELARAVAA